MVNGSNAPEVIQGRYGDSPEVVECGYGYKPTNGSVICGSDGEYYPEVKCVKDCFFPGVPNSDNDEVQWIDPDLGGTVTITCDTGYEISPSVIEATLTCGSDFTFDQPIPTCSPVVCETGLAMNGTIPAGVFGDSKFVVCKSGYELPVTPIPYSCEPNGTWVGGSSCIEKTCSGTGATAVLHQFLLVCLKVLLTIAILDTPLMACWVERRWQKLRVN